MSGAVPDLGAWQPSEEVVEDVVTPAVASGLHQLLDAPGAAPEAGDPLPPLWHWLAFLPRVAQSEIGPDGHPCRGGFLPPVALPRRMFVGGEFYSRRPGTLRVGAQLLRRGRVVGVEAKAGRSGELVFVELGYRLENVADAGRKAIGDGPGNGFVGIEEVQRLVYRPGAPSGSGSAVSAVASENLATELGPDDPKWTMGFDVPIDPTLLFRFSALTYNAHRIHYDRQWATVEEGYPGLVVHGPLQAIALAELCRRDLRERLLTAFRFRAVHPAFDDGPLHVRGRLIGDAVEMVAFDHSSRPTMSASADLAP